MGWNSGAWYHAVIDAVSGNSMMTTGWFPVASQDFVVTRLVYR